MQGKEKGKETPLYELVFPIELHRVQLRLLCVLLLRCSRPSSLLHTPPLLIKWSSLKVLQPPHRSWFTDQTSSYPFRNQIVSFYGIVLLKSDSSWHRISRQGWRKQQNRISCETYLLATRYRNFRIIFPSMCEHQRVCVSVCVLVLVCVQHV